MLRLELSKILPFNIEGTGGILIPLPMEDCLSSMIFWREFFSSIFVRLPKKYSSSYCLGLGLLGVLIPCPLYLPLFLCRFLGEVLFPM